MSVALVTGGHGFVGTHLRAYLGGSGWQVVSIGRGARTPAQGERYAQLDLAGAGDDAVALIDEVQPDVVFHLAGTREPGSDPSAAVDNVVLGIRGLCAAIRRVGRPVRLVIAGSSAQYGAQPDRVPVAEDAACRPIDAYGFAKVAAEAIALGLAMDGAFEVIAARPFNQIGPGQGESTVAGALARRVRSVARGEAERVRAADLSVVRDYTDVRDTAAAYVALAERALPGQAYNLCSGRGTSVAEMLDDLLEVAGLGHDVVESASSQRPGLLYQVGSPRLMSETTGWEAATTVRESLEALYRSLEADGTSSRNGGST